MRAGGGQLSRGLTPSPGCAGSSPLGEQLSPNSSPKGEVDRECGPEGVC